MTHHPDPAAAAVQDHDTLIVTRPRCKRCGSTHLLAYGTRRGSDDPDAELFKYLRCKICGNRHKSFWI